MNVTVATVMYRPRKMLKMQNKKMKVEIIEMKRMKKRLTMKIWKSKKRLESRFILNLILTSNN